MSIEYSYEIVNVDEPNRCMEIVYTSEGRTPLHVGARLPYQGESLDDVVSQFAPVWIWLEKDMVVVPPVVGHKGGGVQGSAPSVPVEEPVTLESVRAQKLREIMAWRYAREIGGVTFEGVTIATDRESQQKITGALVGMKDNFSATLDWKAADGQWITLTVEMLTAMSRAVFDHVQACYQMEKTYSQLVSGATTIEEVGNIILPQ
jgi:hypothetical protein